VNATDWATVASLATALGTLILAVATFSAIRAANVMAPGRQVVTITRAHREFPAPGVDF